MLRAADANKMCPESRQLTPRFFERRTARARHNMWEQDHLPLPLVVVVSPVGLEPTTR